MAHSLPLSFMTLTDEAQIEALDSRGTFTTMTQGGTKNWPARQVALLAPTTKTASGSSSSDP